MIAPALSGDHCRDCSRACACYCRRACARRGRLLGRQPRDAHVLGAARYINRAECSARQCSARSRSPESAGTVGQTAARPGGLFGGGLLGGLAGGFLGAGLFGLLFGHGFSAAWAALPRCSG